ncbi:MAG: flagellar FliJ family protein [Candidatus Neomarinimicrobiota bacterium]
MARGDFRHQRLLDVRELQLQLKAVTLKDSQDQHRDRNRELEELRSAKQTHLKIGAPSVLIPDMSLQARDFMVQVWHTQRLNTDLRHQVHSVQVASEEVEKQRKVVEQAAKEKRTLEKLKEQYQKSVRIQQDRDERKATDEVAALRHRQGGMQEVV